MPAFLDSLKWDSNGLATAIVQARPRLTTSADSPILSHILHPPSPCPDLFKVQPLQTEASCNRAPFHTQ